MPQKDDNNWIFPFAMVGALIYLVVIAILAITMFLAVLMTIMAICAWKNPVTFLGLTMEPEEAQAFVYRGLAGSILVPAFFLFCVAVFGIEVVDEAWGLLWLGGYTLGSVGVEFLLSNLGEQAASADEQVILPPLTELPDIKPAQKAEPAFRFAEWLD